MSATGTETLTSAAPASTDIPRKLASDIRTAWARLSREAAERVDEHRPFSFDKYIILLAGIGDTLQEKNATDDLAEDLLTRSQGYMCNMHHTSCSQEHRPEGTDKLGESLDVVLEDVRRFLSARNSKSTWKNFQNRARDQSAMIRLLERMKHIQDEIKVLYTVDIHRTSVRVEKVVSETRMKQEQYRQRREAQDDASTLSDCLPYVPEGFKPTDLCEKGTRTDILHEMRLWSSNRDAGNIFWLRGPMGSGKSTIANTLVKQFKDDRVYCTCFFFRPPYTLQNAFNCLVRDLTMLSPELHSAILKAVRLDPSLGYQDPDTQFRELIYLPIKAIVEANTWTRPPVIVVWDGIDECRTSSGRHDWKTLLRIVREDFPALSQVLRFIVTTRRRRDLDALLAGSSSTARHHTLSRRNDEQDIGSYLRSRFRALVKDNPMPFEHHITRLLGVADGLFLSASYALECVEENCGSPEHLDELMDEAPTYISQQLDAVYGLVLTDIKNLVPPSAFRNVVGALVVINQQVDVTKLAALLKPMKRTAEIISDLGSVLVGERDDLSCSLHKGFLDFVTNPARCSLPEYCLSLKEQHPLFAARCLNILSNGLSQDLSLIVGSNALNKDINDLPNRLKTLVSAELEYACTCLFTHLQEASDAPEILNPLQTFFKSHLLSWLELMSLMGKVDQVGAALQLLAHYVKVQHPDASLRSVLQDANRFMQHFDEVLRTAASHIRLSARLFAPLTSEFHRRYCRSPVAGQSRLSLICGRHLPWEREAGAARAWLNRRGLRAGFTGAPSLVIELDGKAVNVDLKTARTSGRNLPTWINSEGWPYQQGEDWWIKTKSGKLVCWVPEVHRGVFACSEDGTYIAFVRGLYDVTILKVTDLA